MAKKLVFGSDFMIYGAPFYKWYRFTYGAVTHVPLCLSHTRQRSKTRNKSLTTLCRFKTLTLNQSPAPYRVNKDGCVCGGGGGVCAVVEGVCGVVNS